MVGAQDAPAVASTTRVTLRASAAGIAYTQGRQKLRKSTQLSLCAFFPDGQNRIGYYKNRMECLIVWGKCAGSRPCWLPVSECSLCRRLRLSGRGRCLSARRFDRIHEFSAAARAGDPVKMRLRGALQSRTWRGCRQCPGRLLVPEGRGRNFPSPCATWPPFTRMATAYPSTLLRPDNGSPRPPVGRYRIGAPANGPPASRNRRPQAAPIASFPVAPARQSNPRPAPPPQTEAAPEAPAIPVPAPAPVAAQQAAMTPPAAGTSGNWLLGQWQGGLLWVAHREAEDRIRPRSGPHLFQRPSRGDSVGNLSDSRRQDFRDDGWLPDGVRQDYVYQQVGSDR